MDSTERTKLIEKIIREITSVRNIFTDEALIEMDKMLNESGIRR
jgi:hypothetical protein